MQRLFLRCSVLCLLLGLIISTPQVGRSQEHSPHQPNTTYPVPTAPDRQAMSDITSFGGGVRFIYPHDGRTYVGQQNRFTIYDLTSTPVRQLGQQTVPGYITDISVQNNRAYVTYTVVGVGGGLIVFDVSDPSHIIALDGIANTSGVYQVIVQVVLFNTYPMHLPHRYSYLQNPLQLTLNL